ncbi:MAG: PIN domain-containing protein [Coriobacteriia bacterium]|nr:PIN domain-containing protein [Coriobacteriia bacterium]
MRRESLDTNILLRLLIKSQLPDQHAAAKKLILSSRVKFFVSDTVIGEIVYVLTAHYNFSRERVRYAVDSLLDISSLDLNRDLVCATLELYCTHNALSYADCYLAASADYMNALPLWTFDKDLAKRADMAQLLDVV